MQNSNQLQLSLRFVNTFKFKVLFAALGFVVLVLLGSYLMAPRVIKLQDYSTVVLDTNDHLLAARISNDGQWRFPRRLSLDAKYKTCVIEFEDKRFYYHPGIDVLALIRAIHQNISLQKIHSGASTISMQAARLLLGNRRRTFVNKALECWYALGLELNFTKSEILDLYAGCAPFGGNVVGYDAALWRYFKKAESELTWAQSALLAVLPNQPASVHMERNRNILKERRNALLLRLKQKDIITNETYELSLLEPIPDKMNPIPQNSGLLIDFLIKRYPGQYEFRTSISESLQIKLSEITRKHAGILRDNEIHNCAVLLVENKSGFVRTYIANAPPTDKLCNNSSVDNIQSLRSSGSVLKPLLVAAALDKGLINQTICVSDVPCLIGGFRPENFSRQYLGFVPLQEALRQSLNIPAVRMLQNYGLKLFYDKLGSLGFSSINKSHNHYGLSLILGGAEISVWDLAKVYSNLVFQLEQRDYNSNIKKRSFRKDLKILSRDSTVEISLLSNISVSDAAIFEMLRLMQSPLPLKENITVTDFSSELNPSWKTGTSFGFKDAWCVGITNKYTLVVWLGNSNGLGRPGLIGIHTAAPLMSEIINSLSPATIWTPPVDDMHPAFICARTGLLASSDCPVTDTILQASVQSLYPLCSYHQRIFIDSVSGFRVTKDCDVKAVAKNIFILPPLEEYYYKNSDVSYKSSPAWRQDCLHQMDKSKEELSVIYPLNGAVLFLPKDLDSQENNLVFRAVHKNSHSSIHWFLDENYIKTTSQLHEIEIKPNAGKHHLFVIDDQGQSHTVGFRCERR